jgi:hypothetical protein
MEVSLVSALTAIFSASLKVAKFNRQEALNQYIIFSGGDHDLLLIPVDPSYSLLLAGNGFANRETIFDTLEAMLAVRNEVGKSLRSMGVTAELKQPSPTVPSPKKKGKTGDLKSAPPAPEMEALLNEAGKKKVKQEEMDAFWNQAAEQHANKTTNSEVISYEEARKMGLTPDQKK